MHKITTIIDKEWAEVFRNKLVLFSVIFLPLILLILPVATVWGMSAYEGEMSEEVPAEMPNAPYPEGPYGTSEGATIPNLNFEGWLTPDAVGYDTTQIQTVALSEFYNPDDDQGIELLLINVSAVWCGVCQAEYIDIRDSGVYESMKPRGLEILGLLFQDRRGDVPQRSDLETWSTTFDVNFPFALDPEFDTEAFFDGAGTPMNMIVDARTMELIMPMNGYSSEIFNIIDRELRSRGR